MASSTTIPVLFTLPPSSRHEFLLLPYKSPTSPTAPAPITIKELNRLIVATISKSPNCAEFMGSYKPQSDSPPHITEIRVHWAEAGRDRRVWPQYTIITEDNLAAVLDTIARGGGIGRDVLEIKVKNS